MEPKCGHEGRVDQELRALFGVEGWTPGDHPMPVSSVRLFFKKNAVGEVSLYRDFLGHPVLHSRVYDVFTPDDATARAEFDGFVAQGTKALEAVARADETGRTP